MAPGADFDALQRRLVQRLRATSPEADAATILVCPSISFPDVELRKIVGIEFYEERLLFLALLLQDPQLDLVYVTSVPVDDAVVQYYLGFLADPDDARRRLHLFTVDDPTPMSLTSKLLDRPHVIDAIRSSIRDPQRSFILPFNVTFAEAQLASLLGIAIYGTHPDLVWLGSKSGARIVAAEAGVPVFAGAGGLASIGDIEEAIEAIRAERPAAVAAVAKLNNGFSGQGNVIIEMDGFRRPLPTSTAVFCAAEETWETYTAKVVAEGAVVEELARDPGTVSPSVQLRVLPGERIEIISTHDQILGGPDEQVYLGCRFPADDAYRAQISEAARRVGQVLARRGVIGSFGIDFVVVPTRGIFLSEINLRLGGTTHPYLMTQYVTGGSYDPGSGRLLVDGQPRVYKSSDNIKSPRYVGLRPADVIAAVADAGLAFQPATGTGVTLHLLGALPGYGKCGVVAIGASAAQADELYDRVLACIEQLAVTAAGR